MPLVHQLDGVNDDQGIGSEPWNSTEKDIRLPGSSRSLQNSAGVSEQIFKGLGLERVQLPGRSGELSQWANSSIDNLELDPSRSQRPDHNRVVPSWHNQ